VRQEQGAGDARRELLSAVESLRWVQALPPLARPADARHAAVLVLFGVLDSVVPAVPDAAVARELDVLLQRRAATLRSHPSEVSFPGGRREPGDADAVATALREAEEETGVDPRDVEILGRLPELPLAASSHLVTPVVAWWRTPSQVAAVDHAETVDVLRVPVAELLDPASRFMSVWMFRGREREAPAFDVGGTIVWGFTAIVLDRLFDAAGWTVPWDTSRTRPVEEFYTPPVGSGG
jgi:8-oxo-dGTP pyrophosphatase MutT (NUDIX family)